MELDVFVRPLHSTSKRGGTKWWWYCWKSWSFCHQQAEMENENGKQCPYVLTRYARMVWNLNKLILISWSNSAFCLSCMWHYQGVLLRGLFVDQTWLHAWVFWFRSTECSLLIRLNRKTAYIMRCNQLHFMLRKGQKGNISVEHFS